MCRAGGPRCTGSRSKTTSTATTAAPVAAAPPEAFESLARAAQVTAANRSGGSVPNRERTDELADALPSTRTGWDGKPLDDKGRRLFALRESGYTGPIDQDGYPDTTSDDAATLRRMAQDRGETVTW